MSQNRNLRISCVHQGYELYGSDRCFAESVKAIRRAYPDAEIEVVLPHEGPILELFEGLGCRIVFAPIWVLRRRTLAKLATTGLTCFLPGIVRAAWRMYRNDLVYINTSVIADHMVAARLFRGKTILHVHELPEGATLRLLRLLVRWSRAEIIFNSNATRAAFALPAMRSQVIYNGIAGPRAPAAPSYDGRRPLRVLMLGRINGTKGQEVLVEAIRQVPDLHQRIAVRMVGGAFENESKEVALRTLVRDNGLADIVAVLPFSADPDEHLRWADVVVVPSRRSEALGRVAIEAMAYGRPPIVSDVGGLREIVEHDHTGWLVPPERPEALAARLRAIIEAPASLADKVEPARRRYEALFSEGAAAAAISSVVATMIGPSRHRGGRLGPDTMLLDRA
ncbi:glycosyltransferase family 4 protein [Labrys wisconsinensis]|uniref:Glycosyltransferase involved in cell wall biosynthesis n=1 Tax=Labrys wisconsinensis TaxID=425677 RepID=A0ABU0J4L6_9HYPH|nr:glycosyltransferase family 4 protein [Labrys wisconsinensis]MDQ0469208.1 glycosyltransferase involved in cell wall biosynthesis [Labrys wisconsinensis]